MTVVTETVAGAPPADEPRALDPRYIPMQRLVGLISTLGVSGALLVPITGAFVSERGPSGWGRLAVLALWLLVVVALTWHAYQWPALEHAHTRYRLDEGGIEIRRGVFWRRVTSVPRSRVQHTDVSQGPLERRYGLGTLVVYTAGADHAKVSLPGLSHDEAVALRDRLTPGGGADAV
jgi:membrane protein YdbS with pleckstrin-like domain